MFSLVLIFWTAILVSSFFGVGITLTLFENQNRNAVLFRLRDFLRISPAKNNDLIKTMIFQRTVLTKCFVNFEKIKSEMI